jgi:hypothetical protein
LREVVMAAVYLEQNARVQLQALAIGGGRVHYLSPEEVDRTSAMLTDSLASDRAWNTWRTRIGLEEA